MVKIIIFVAIAALACVNAQNDFFPGFGPGGPAGMFNSPIFGPIFRNFKIPTPQEMYQANPGPNVNYHAMGVESDGNQMVIHKNDNGKKTSYVIKP